MIGPEKAGNDRIELHVQPGKGKIHVRYGDREIITPEFSVVSGGTETVSARLVAPARLGSGKRASEKPPKLPVQNRPSRCSPMIFGRRRQYCPFLLF